MKGTVAIIGSHPRTRSEFDFERTDCDVWLFNEAMSGKKNEWAKRADAVFQIHDEIIWRNPSNRNDEGHCKWLKEQKDIKVYMQDKYKDVPMSVRYPLDEITERFSISYFTSSVAYALALACYLGYKRLELYGVEMETNTEYQYQRDGVALWLGLARGLGMEIDAHISMFDQPLYGYEGEVTIPYETFERRVTELQPLLDDLTAQYQAAFFELQKAFDLFHGDGSQAVEQKLFATASRQRDIAQQLGEISGRMQENKKYRDKADTMKEAAGDFLFSRQEFESAASTTKTAADKSKLEFVSLGTQLDMIHRNVKVAAKGSRKRDQLMEAYMQQTHIYLQSANRTAVYIGASKENYEHLAWLDKHVRAAGGEKSEAVLLERIREDAKV